MVARVVVAVAIAQASTLTATALATGAEHGAPRCPGTHEKVVVADAQAVVYQARLPREEGRGIYACAYGHRSYVLGSGLARGPASGGTGGAFGVDDETLAGNIVAYEEVESFTEGHTKRIIVVRDLRTGRVMHEAPTAEAQTPGDVGKGSARSLVVKSDGAVAWIVETVSGPTVGGIGPPTIYEVRAVDKTGSRLLASGGDIDPSSLALAGSTLYWTQGGQPFSAQLQ